MLEFAGDESAVSGWRVLDRCARIVNDEGLALTQVEKAWKDLDHPRYHLGLENPIGDALLPPGAAGADRGQGLAGQDFQFGDMAAALELRHALGLGHVGVVVEGQDDGGHAVIAVELCYVRLELLPDVVVPGEEPLGIPAHQADLPVAEDGFRLERRELCEGLGSFLLEGGDP